MRKVLFLALLISLAMTMLSAYIRLADSSLGCESWPSCFLDNVWIDTEPGLDIKINDSHASLRALHRIMASIFGIVSLVLLVMAYWYRKVKPIGFFEANLVFFLTLVLSIVGLNTPNVLLPMITLINISGGMLLSAILFVWINKLDSPKFKYWRNTKVIVVMSLFSFFAIMSGAWMTSNYAASVCSSLLNCSHFSEASFLTAFSLNRDLALINGRIMLDGNESLIGLMHFFFAGLTIAYGTYICFVKLQPSKPTVIVASLLGVLLLQGVLDIVVDNHLMASLHSALATLLLLSILNLMREKSYV